MKRRPITVLSALSLLLCVGMCVLWARSYWRSGWVYAPGLGTIGGVFSTRGSICVWRDSDVLGDDRLSYESDDDLPIDQYLPSGDPSDIKFDPHTRLVRFAGFALSDRREQVDEGVDFSQSLIVPH